MIKNFENKYGKPNKTILVVGDYDKSNNNMKGKEPTICKKFRRIFRNAGYKTFLVNEFRTIYKKSLDFLYVLLLEKNLKIFF